MDIAAVHKRLGQKIQIGFEEAAITGYTVRTGNWVQYELTYIKDGEVLAGVLTAQALADLEESQKKPNINWESCGPVTK